MPYGAPLAFPCKCQVSPGKANTSGSTCHSLGSQEGGSDLSGTGSVREALGARVLNTTLVRQSGACSGHSSHHIMSAWSVFTAEIKKD